MYRIMVLTGLMLGLSAGSALAMAKEGCGGECVSCHSLSEKEAGTLLKGLGTVKSVKPSPVRGLYELRLEKDGTQAIAYVDYGKKNIIAGQIFDIASRQLVTTKITASPIKAEKIDVGKIPLDNSLVMGNANGTKKLFVFTDPDCPYCANMHAELKKLVEMDKDIAVYVKLFPLEMHPKAYDKSRLILSENSLNLLDTAFSGGKLPEPDAKHSGKGIDETKAFARSVGISSTPTLVLPDGRILPGFRDALAVMRSVNGETL